MCKFDAKKVVAAMAQRHGISVEQVIMQMEAAIALGCANPDVEVQAFWTQVPRSGYIPTALEFIQFLALQAGSQQNTTASHC